MNRRTFLAAGGAAAMGGVAGCLGSNEVEFVSVTDAIDWHGDGETVFVDARSQAEFDSLRIEDAVLSPAADGLPEGDPVEGLDTDTRLVTYCVCPHALAEQRGESLLEDGYGDVSALDEGLEEWVEQGYPIAGSDVEESLPSYEVRGVSDPAHAGEDVWIREPETAQRELAPVSDDGSYEMTLHFVDIDEETLLEVEAPDYTVEAPLGEITSGVVGEDVQS